MQTTPYEHSGKIGLSIVIPIFSVPIAVLLSLVYAYADVYIPFVYVSFLISIAYGVGVGSVITFASKRLKCRSPRFLVAAGLFNGLVALYAAWVAFIWVLLRRDHDDFDGSFVEILLAPAFVWEALLEVGENGWYTIFADTPVKGIFLWVFWIIEAGIIVGLPTLMALGSLVDEVFWEDCNEWCRPGDRAARLLLPEDAAPDTLDFGDIAVLEGLETMGEKTRYPHVRVDLRACDRCDETAAMQIKLVRVDVDKKGQESEEEDDLTEPLLISREIRTRLEALADRSAAPESSASGG